MSIVLMNGDLLRVWPDYCSRCAADAFDPKELSGTFNLMSRHGQRKDALSHMRQGRGGTT
jgi:hypothetical protein